MQFTTQLIINPQSTLMWYHYIIVPSEIAEQLGNKKTRLIITINNHSFNVALMPNKGEFFINMGKPICAKCKIKPLQTFIVYLQLDNSEYGMPVCEEFNALLTQDPLFCQQFNALNPGAKRSLLHIINKVKSSTIKIQKVTALAEHLRDWNGKLDFKALQAKFKENNSY